jgi:predicted metalloendopeptidase
VRYRERAQAIVAQYDAYAGVDGLKVNGKLTLGENIADLGGLRIAHLGLQRALDGKPRDKIEGFTPEQRFFLLATALARPARAERCACSPTATPRATACRARSRTCRNSRAFACPSPRRRAPVSLCEAAPP